MHLLACSPTATANDWAPDEQKNNVSHTAHTGIWPARDERVSNVNDKKQTTPFRINMWSDIRKQSSKKWTSAVVLLPGNKRRLNAKKIFENVRIIGKHRDRKVAFLRSIECMQKRTDRTDGKWIGKYCCCATAAKHLVVRLTDHYMVSISEENWYSVLLFQWTKQMRDCAKGKKKSFGSVVNTWKWRIRIFRAEIKTELHGIRCSSWCSRPDSQ